MFQHFFFNLWLVTPDDWSEGYMAKDQDDQITEFKIETGRGKQEKAVSCLSIIRPTRHLMLQEGAKFRRNRKKHKKQLKHGPPYQRMLWLFNIYSGSQGCGLIPGCDISWKLLDVQKPLQSCRKLGNILGTITALLLCSAVSWAVSYCPKMRTQTAAYFITIGKTKKSHFTFIKELWIFTYTHLISHLSCFYQKLTPCYWVWWRWACSFGVCFS